MQVMAKDDRKMPPNPDLASEFLRRLVSNLYMHSVYFAVFHFRMFVFARTLMLPPRDKVV